MDILNYERGRIVSKTELIVTIRKKNRQKPDDPSLPY